MDLKGGPTQDEVMAVSLFRLNLKPGDIMADIGCGTGKVSIKASRVAGKVIALDRREEAVACARAGISEAGAENIEVIKGEAAEIIRSLDHLDCAFVGGSRDLETVLKHLSEKVRGMIVVNAVLLETLNTAVITMKELGIFQEVIHVQIARSYPLAGGIMLKPQNPVYIIIGRCS